MATEISSKSEFSSLSTELSTKVSSLNTDINSMVEILNGVSNYDGIDMVSAANKIKNSITNVVNDMQTASANIASFNEALTEFDIDDFANGTDGARVIELNYTDKDSSNLTYTELNDSENSNNNLDSWTGLATNLGNTNYSSSTPNYGGSGTPYVPSAPYVPNTPSVPDVPQWSGDRDDSDSSSKDEETVNVYDKYYEEDDDDLEVLDCSKIDDEMTVTPTGVVSEDGRTERSASSEFVIKQGDFDDPEIDITKYSDNEEYGIEVTMGNLAYELCEDDVDLLYAIVASESDKSYDDSLAVITTILNRCETSSWIEDYGRDPVAQATALDQFITYQNGSYEKYMGNRAPQSVVRAVNDALAGVRNHKYTGFESSASRLNENVVTTGNLYNV